MSSNSSEIMIYGVYGYSAKLILEELSRRNIYPVVAGRNEEMTKIIAGLYNCDYRVFDLSNDEVIKENLKGIKTLLNCAGPFRFTANKFFDACLITKTNYLDITGEIEVIEKAWKYNKQAENTGIVILPSVGFDVIPTDCLAKKLKDKLPDAENLFMGFMNIGGGLSRGTWLTTFEMMGEMGKIRQNGKIIDSQIGEKTYVREIKNYNFYGISIPWGDVSSAYYSTGIPNIQIFLGVPKFVFNFRKAFSSMLKLFSFPFIKNVILKIILAFASGPEKEKRDNTKTYVWGKVTNEKGQNIEEVYRFMEGYNLTAVGAVECLLKVNNNEVGPGTKTPSLAFGSNFMRQFILE